MTIFAYIITRYIVVIHFRVIKPRVAHIKTKVAHLKGIAK